MNTPSNPPNPVNEYEVNGAIFIHIHSPVREQIREGLTLGYFDRLSLARWVTGQKLRRVTLLYFCQGAPKAHISGTWLSSHPV